MSGLAASLAADIISQLTEDASDFDIAFSAEYKREYISKLDDLAQPSTHQMTLILAPVDMTHNRDAWGEVHSVITLGMAAQITVSNSSDAAEMDPSEKFVDDLAMYFCGARKFDSYWECTLCKPTYGDHYNNSLKEKSEFHVPILLQFQRRVVVT